MSKTKFTFTMIGSIFAGFLIIGVLRWLGLYISLAAVWHNIFGEPDAISITIVSLITVLFSYLIVSRLYKKYVKS
ncbi:hypothetical protein [Lentibacillus sediminis]|uniref:hypothetical protein n=1 Tax=Lentibacillus sediminis TaxID=1940529 RepID=UPI000C1C164E|nr:hypothetical protein [Lentibacillus sediminis]